jgi:hypothetical protein
VPRGHLGSELTPFTLFVYDGETMSQPELRYTDSFYAFGVPSPETAAADYPTMPLDGDGVAEFALLARTAFSTSETNGGRGDVTGDSRPDLAVEVNLPPRDFGPNQWLGILPFEDLLP